MLTPDQVTAYNARTNFTNVSKLSTEQQDRAIAVGTDAERLLSDANFALFVNSFKFEIIDEIAGLSSHTDEINNKRIGLSNQLSGVERFVEYLQRASILKERLVTMQKGSVAPDQN
jgi:hypothetical protein